MSARTDFCVVSQGLPAAMVGLPLRSGLGPEFDRSMPVTAMSPRSGCQSKVSGSSLESILATVNAALPGVSTVDPLNPDDCAAVKTDGGTLLATTDFHPLVGANLQTAGVIAALHSLSDIYASGGVPKWALVNAILTAEQVDDGGEAVLGGIWDACRQDGVTIVGGQTIVGADAMVGLTALGVPRDGVIVGKRGARSGDVLLCSKPLGVGLIVRAFKLQLIDEAAVQPALDVMSTSNRVASEQMLRADVSAATDITGFGLLGHLTEMLGPGQGATLDATAIPVLESALNLPDGLARTPWIAANRDYVRDRIELVTDHDGESLAPLFDPQTNGGLLVSVVPDRAPRLAEAGFTAIGTVTESGTLAVT